MTNNDISQQKQQDEILELAENEKELENYMTAKSSETLKNDPKNPNRQSYNSVEPLRNQNQNAIQANDGLGLENLELLN